MIKKIKIELIILGVLFLSIFFLYNFDIWLYNFFNSLDKTLQNTYLKQFFEQITILGDSKWYFLLSLFTILICYALNYFFPPKKKNSSLKVFLEISIFLFSSLFITGLITQTLKHLVGRPRPSYVSLDNNIGFEFINLNSEFHSFPSGHTSTIFVVALVFVYFIPKLKYLFFSLAGLIAFSRIVIGAHFFTDILGGIVVSFIGIKIANLFINKYFPTNKIEQINPFFDNKVFFSLSFLFLVMIFLSIGSSIDIYFSSLFYYGNSNFLLQSNYSITIFFRKILLPLLIFYIFILPIVSIFFPIRWLYFNYKFKVRDVAFLWVSSIVNLLLIINLLLKNFWGRSRPGDILQLGGKENFTPWYQISDTCNTNCSFVSGDAAVGFSLIVLYFLTKKEIFFWLSIFFGFSIGLIRIMEGGHFASDVVMSSVILYLAYYFQTKYYINKYV